MSVDRQHDRATLAATAHTDRAQTDRAQTDPPSTAGLLHDLGHQIMTVSLLAESLQAELNGDQNVSAEARQRTELVVQETARALGMIAGKMPSAPAEPDSPAQLIDMRVLAGQLTRLAAIAHETSIELEPGPPAYVRVSPALAWRAAWNLIDNAARAAGPEGRVTVAVCRGTGTAIEVTDDGPGYGDGGPGTSGVGLSAVTQLLATTGGYLDISAGPDGGTVARAVFGGGCDRIVLPRMRDARKATT
jgi:signal transduction histidine kinase